MAFDYSAVAISWREGVYDIVEKYDISDPNELDWASLELENKWNNVSESTSFQDLAMVVSKPTFGECAVGSNVKAFYSRTSEAHAFFYVIHRAEWESSLGN